MLPRTYRRLTVLLLVCLMGVIPLQAQESLSPDEIEKIAQSVVRIGIIQDGYEIGNGSGTIISADGLIYTNKHVVESAEDLAIYMLEDINEQPVLRYYAYEVTSFEEMDFAIIQIYRDENGDPLAAERLNLPFLEPSSEPARRGEQIYAFGYPLIGEGYLVLTEGTITTVQNGNVGLERMAVWYQTDAEILPGNSGGLAVNREGRVLGIPSSVMQDFETQGRLGGILPFPAILMLTEVGTEIMVSATGLTPQTGSEPIVIECEGSEITNGVELLVKQMRPDFEYVITAISSGLDPVLVIRDAARPTDYICSDDSAAVGSMSIDLPGAGKVRGGERGAALQFSHSSSQSRDISIVVGSKDSKTGDIVLIIEGMAITEDDTPGDAYMLSVTSQMVDSRIALDAYMIGVDSALDPMLLLVDEDLEDIVQDVRGDAIYCDDAGSDECWRNNESLEDASITTSEGKRLNADGLDAMFYMMRPDLTPGRLTFLATSYDVETVGRYVLIFRIGL